MRLLLDEDTQAKRLVLLLRSQGHDVVTVADCDHRGVTDAEVLAIAKSYGRVLLTRNCADFLALHRQHGDHPGILCVFQDNDPSKALSYLGIAQSLKNLEDAAVPLRGAFLALNAWRY